MMAVANRGSTSFLAVESHVFALRNRFAGAVTPYHCKTNKFIRCERPAVALFAP